jgi:flagellar biosynthesis/type III secretory pathway chaperone
MIENQDQWDGIWALWEEEVSAHQSLRETIQKEWEALTRGDIAALASTLPEKEKHLLRIFQIHQTVEDRLFAMMPKTAESQWIGSAWAPAPQAKRIDHYRDLLSRMRREIHEANERNKRFIQESLNFIHDLFSLLTAPQKKEEVLYSPEGRKKKMPLTASWVSRKV